MRTRVVSGGDLFHIALQEYNDATAWNIIAEANGLLDPLIVGTMTLKIPAYSPTETGGVLEL
jgi:nucleoid-associated protein YgaU